MAFTNEQSEKAKAAASVDELIALAKAEEIELSEEKAKAIFAELHAEEAELSDMELDNVAGGGCPDDIYADVECSNCRTMNPYNQLHCVNCGNPLMGGEKSL